MKVPKINWIPFDKDNPPSGLSPVEKYLIFFRSDNYDNGASWTYLTDCAEPFGDYLDNFWNTENDWFEGQQIEVLAYAEFPCWMKEDDLCEE